MLQPCHVVEFLPFIWRLGTRRWNLRVPNLQMDCSNLTSKIGHQDSSPSNGWGLLLQVTCSVMCPMNLRGTPNSLVFIRPSLDGTYYGMALSVHPSVRSSVRLTVSTKKHRCKWRIFFKFCTQVCLGVPSINLLFVLSYLIRYAHNSIISDFSIFGIQRVII